jgi:hypothetical protein
MTNSEWCSVTLHLVGWCIGNKAIGAEAARKWIVAGTIGGNKIRAERARPKSWRERSSER